MGALQLLRELNSSLRGLVEDEADQRLIVHGENVSPALKQRSLIVVISRAWLDPFVLVLLFLGAVSALTGDSAGVVVTAILATLSCGLRAAQEHRADRAAKVGRADPATTTTVLRRAHANAEPVPREVPPELLVPGDIVRLVSGDAVPADLALLRTAGFTVNQALLTGEALPVAKHAALVEAQSEPAPAIGDDVLFDNSRLCLLGTTVVGGTATAVVVATGADTYFATRHKLLPYPRGRTTFDRGVRGVSWTLIRFMMVGVVLVLALSDLSRDSLLQTCLFAVAVAVGLIPEMLPVVVTTALIRAQSLLRFSGVVVKNLPAVHNLGAMDVVCVDKTGTLTLGRLSVTSQLDPRGNQDSTALMYAYLNARFSVDWADPPVQDTVDDALLRHGEHTLDTREDRYVLMQALAFDATRRRSSVVLREVGRRRQLLMVTKGAAESVVACCTHVRIRGRDIALSADRRRRLDALADELQADGTRLLAIGIAARPLDVRPLRVADESGLTLIGYVGLRDEPKHSAPTLLAKLSTQAVQVKILTGDHPAAALRFCHDAGVDPGHVVVGQDIDCLDDEQLRGLAEQATVFARVDAGQKARIVGMLRRAGHTVGYVGDGVNDAPAMHAADVAIGVEGAVDLAQQTSDVLLRGKDSPALADAVQAARQSYSNIIKYVKITVSSNFGNVCAVLVASATLPFLPMLPLQILVQNLLFDLSQLSLAFDHTDAQTHARPRTFQTVDLTRFVVFFGTLNALTDIATFLVLRHALASDAAATSQILFHTGWFVENLLTQLIAVHLLRSRTTMPRSWAARPVLITSAAVAMLCLLLPETPLGRILQLSPLPGTYYLWLTLILIAYGIALVGAKHLYQRLFRSWL
jgi:Mg2+-importing ATPase